MKFSQHVQHQTHAGKMEEEDEKRKQEARVLECTNHKMESSRIKKQDTGPVLRGLRVDGRQE